MPKLLSRIVALFLIPCLIGDPASASAFSNSLSPTSERAGPQTSGDLGEGGGVLARPFDAFQDQALMLSLMAALQGKPRALVAQKFRALGGWARKEYENSSLRYAHAIPLLAGLAPFAPLLAALPVGGWGVLPLLRGGLEESEDTENTPPAAPKENPEENFRRLGHATVGVSVDTWEEAVGGVVAEGPDDWFVLTVAHVVKNAKRLDVIFTSEENLDLPPTRSVEVPATLVGLDTDADLALLKIDKSKVPDDIPVEAASLAGNDYHPPAHRSPVFIFLRYFRSGYFTSNEFRKARIRADFGSITEKITYFFHPLWEGASGSLVADDKGIVIGLVKRGVKSGIQIALAEEATIRSEAVSLGAVQTFLQKHLPSPQVTSNRLPPAAALNRQLGGSG